MDFVEVRLELRKLDEESSPPMVLELEKSVSVPDFWVARVMFLEGSLDEVTFDGCSL